MRFAFAPYSKYPSREVINPGNTAAKALIDTAWANIEVIHIGACGLMPIGGAALGLACARHWRQLRIIKLHDNAVRCAFLSEFVRGEYPLLEELDLSNNHFDSTAGALLAKLAVRCPRLRILNLQLNRLDEPGLCDMLRVEFACLENLSITHTAFHSHVALSKLATSCPSLKELNFAWNRFTREALEAFLELELPNLEVLDIRTIYLYDGIAPFLAAAKWPRLHKLITSNQLFNFDDSMQIICQGNWPLLEELNVS